MDNSRPTFEKISSGVNKIDGSFYLPPEPKDLQFRKSQILDLANSILAHKFDLLGSGLTRVYRGMEAEGFAGVRYSGGDGFLEWNDFLKDAVTEPNYPFCLQVSQLIDKEYHPLDWQIDFKSGYRWSERVWYKDIVYGDKRGADVKVPWELGRMQHLPILAYAYILGDEESSEKYLREFVNEIFDFIASNPPRFGVQWVCSMDAAIRLTNWLVAYDMFKGAGAEFNENFEKIFAKSVYEHTEHIFNNLEYSSGLRGNHYLANAAGLLFGAAYLPNSKRSRAILAFALQELVNEIGFQFYRDGGNFEASTSYHSFAAEMVYHSVLLALSLPESKVKNIEKFYSEEIKKYRKIDALEKQGYRIENSKIVFSKEVLDKLKQTAYFSYTVSDLDYVSPKIGDEDGGRFLKLTPQNIDNSQIFPIALFSTLSNCEELLNKRSKFGDSPIFEISIVKRIGDRIGESFIDLSDEFINDVLQQKKFIKDPESEESGVLHYSFPNFGVYCNKTYYYHSIVRCGFVGQLGKGGHSHNDQLSIYLFIKGREFLTDGGTYVYTALPDERNRRRSTAYHNTLHIPNFEQNQFANENTDDLFWIEKHKSKAKSLQFSDIMFIGEHYGYPKPHKRILSFDINNVEGVDLCQLNLEKRVNFHLAPGVTSKINSEGNRAVLSLDGIVAELTCEGAEINSENYNFSPGYGKLKRAEKIILKSFENKVKWNLEIIAV